MWSWLSNRNPGYQKIAERLKLTYSETDVNKSLYLNCRNFKLFKQGNSRKIKYILSGVNAHQNKFFLFEYSYVVSTGKSSATIHQHVFLTEPIQPVPVFSFSAQNAFHQIGKWFGMQDIEFAEYHDFNKNYLVKAKTPKSLEKFFKKDLLGYLSFEKGWSAESDGSKIIFYKPSKRMNEEMVEPFLQAASTLSEIMMGHQSMAQLDSVPSLKKKTNEKKGGL